MHPTYEPIRKPPACDPRGASLIRLLSGRLVRADDTGQVYALTRFADPLPLFLALIKWSQQGNSNSLTTRQLALPEGSLVTVSAGDINLALAALDRISDTRLRREYLDRAECRQRLQWLACFTSNREHACTSAPVSRYRLLPAEPTAVKTSWQGMVRWLAGQKNLPCWYTLMQDLEDVTRPPAWWGPGSSQRRTFECTSRRTSVLARTRP